MIFDMTRIFKVLTISFLLLGSVNAQQYQLKNGKRFSMDEVKSENGNFIVSIPTPRGLETYNFTVKDISVVTFAFNKELLKAEEFFLRGKFDEAIEQTEIAQTANEKYMMLPGSPWTEACKLQLDLAQADGRRSADVASLAKLTKIATSDSALLNRLVAITDAPNTDAGVTQLLEMVKSEENASIKARALLRVGDILKSLGKLEAAAKSYLQIPAFYSSEKFLSLRALTLASDVLYQMQRKEDSVKLLSDFLLDDPTSTFRDVIESKIKMNQSQKASQ